MVTFQLPATPSSPAWAREKAKMPRARSAARTRRLRKRMDSLSYDGFAFGPTLWTNENSRNIGKNRGKTLLTRLYRWLIRPRHLAPFFDGRRDEAAVGAPLGGPGAWLRQL